MIDFNNKGLYHVKDPKKKTIYDIYNEYLEKSMISCYNEDFTWFSDFSSESKGKCTI